FSSRRRHTRSDRDWSSDVCSSDLITWTPIGPEPEADRYARATETMLAILGQGRAGAEGAGRRESEADQQFGRCFHAQFHSLGPRSEERRVGKECRYGRARED